MGQARIVLSVASILLCTAIQSKAVVITFTGGTVTRLDATTQTTNNSANWDNVDYYEEGGYHLDFLPNSGSAGFATHVGDYYSAGNDVIHAHWFTGSFGGVVNVEITKIGGGTFDLNYFVLTSNTDRGGSFASGNEQAFIQGFVGGNPTGPAVLLPPEDWGFPATPIYLGNDFNAVDQVVFTVANHVDCFGMDEFYIDQAAPTASTPEPASFIAWSMIGVCAVVGAGWYRKTNRASVAA
jgi:hypothetical protein